MREPQPGDARGAVEASDVDARRIVAVAAALLVVLALVTGAVRGLLQWWQVPVATSASTPQSFRSDAPQLLPAPLEERATFVAEKDRLLHGYGWADREAGFARIPIEVAIDLLAGGEAAASERTEREGPR
ncbi:MAG: hypothetical protein ROZ37_02395 [Aromatoleum sp.]|jgi:hypothetical protein|uniref:hypothetical protein n=1 Tax=Aromatoleum sp. TaxID=2307007 RepID=UPI0028946586|nr:hypothetical protein [Aromatoleum sp.]MDT3669164.1 hypothetical protein [Aromatoleum sp.]